MKIVKLGFVSVSLFVLVLAVSAPVVTAQDSELDGIHISDVSVSPENPEVGETVTVTATVNNDGNRRFDLSQVRLVDLEESPSIRNLGTVAPGEEVEVELSSTFESEGVKKFRVRASGTTKGIGTVHQSVTVDVGGSSVHVETSSEDAVVDTWVPIDVEVSNGADSKVHNVRINPDGDVRVRDGEAFVPEVGPNDTEATEVLVMSESAGEELVGISVSYTNTNGNTVTVTEEESLNFTEGSNDVELTATNTEEGMEATFLNLGTAAVQDITIGGNGNTEPVEIDGVRGGSSETVNLSVTGLREETRFNLTASYNLGEQRRKVETEAVYTPPADVRLTGTSIQGGTSLTVTGDASNVGTEDAEGVLLEVADRDGVEPGRSQGDFFVGTVPGSDFATFELNAQVNGDVDSVPIEVSYTAGGKRYSRVVEVPYEGGSGSQPPGEPGGEQATRGGFEPNSPQQEESGVPTPVVAAVILGVVGVMAYGWRKRGTEE